MQQLLRFDLMPREKHTQKSSTSFLLADSYLRLDNLKLLISRLHGREEQYFLDIVLVREEHGQPVNTETPTTGGRQTVLESRNEGIVHNHRLIISLAALLRLLKEPLVLNHRIVQLSVSIRELCL